MSDDDHLDIVTFHAYLLRYDRFRSDQMRPYPPLAPLELAAFLEQQGWSAATYDPTLHPDEASFEIELSQTRPRVAALFGHPSTRQTSWRLVRRARRTGALVVALGDDASAVPELYLDHGVDVVIRGEAELTADALLRSLAANGWRFDTARLRGIPGLVLRDGDELVSTPPPTRLLDLDRAPPPLRDAGRTQLYLGAWRAAHGFSELAMVTSRGIPGQPSRRRRNAAAVAAEVADLRRRFAMDRIRFVDTVFTDDPAWHTAFADALERADGPVPYQALGRIRDIDGALLDEMMRGGCMRITFDVGSGSRRLLRQLDRGHGIEQVYRVGRLMRERDLQMGVLVGLGLDGETRADFLATIDMLKVLQPDVWGLTLEDPDVTAVAHELRAAGMPGMRTLRDAWPDGGARRGRRLPLGFYRWALRLLAADIHLDRSWRSGRLDAAGLGMAVARPLYRAMVHAYPVRGR